jgi:very-short-patch-repair endonuclease
MLDRLSEDLDRLEREARGPRRRGNQPEPYESWFEVDVALEILRRRYMVRPQVEIAGKRIDLVVDGLDAQLAVECDGDEWHGPEQYEHDMARQRQLERAGWTFVRLRGSDFYANRQDATRTITDACEELKIYPVDHVGEPREGASVYGPTPETGSAGRSSESVAESSTGADAEGMEADVPSPEHGSFSGYSEVSGFPDPREASPANVQAVLRRIIASDGPLMRPSVYRLYVEGCPGLQRAGKVVRQALDHALGVLLRAGEIVQEDELGDRSLEGQVVRLAGVARVQVRPAGKRDLVDIPPSEILTVLGRLCPTKQGTQEDGEALLRSLLDHYGFSRLTKPRRGYLSKVLRLWDTRAKEIGAADAAPNVEAI